MGVAVDFGDEAMGEPGEVALVGGTDRVDLRPREVVVGAELQEGGFDVAAGALVLVLLELVEDRAQEPATWASGMGLDRVVQLLEVEEVQLGGALDRSPQVVDRDDGGEVEERPRDGVIGIPSSAVTSSSRSVGWR